MPQLQLRPDTAKKKKKLIIYAKKKSEQTTPPILSASHKVHPHPARQVLIRALVRVKRDGVS